jgi:adenylate cyclase
MEQEILQRKLTAILSADVKGYSRLMGEDEAATIRTLTAYREIMENLIRKHRGRVVDSPGDNILAEFGSVVGAVESAVEIQEELKTKNAELPEERRMEFRIGINLGDVVVEGERIYGDGVNIAARIEGLAEGGGICISGTVFDQVENKLSLGYPYLGEQTVKNIKKPVRVYRVGMEPEGAVPRVAEELELPDKPSIAVLPFANLSGDSEQEYLADGISENIITVLSKIPEMFVIARNSAFTYKGKPVKVQQIGKELGVRYVLEGGVQTGGDRIRVTAQLVDTTTGHHLWAERYDRSIDDFFTLLDEITERIVVALQIELTRGEYARSWHSTDNFDAWSCAVKGYGLLEEPSPENNTKARELFREATEIDPDYVFAWAMLAWTHYVDVRGAYTQSSGKSINQAVELAQKASSLDDTLPEVHSLWNTLYLLQGRHDEAIAAGERAIALGPNDALAHTLLAQTMYFAGRFEEAVKLAERAIRLSPYCPAYYLLHLGLAYREAGRYEDAIATFNRFLKRSERGEFPPHAAHVCLAATYGLFGRKEDARFHVREVLRLFPGYSLTIEKKTLFFKDPAHLERIFGALREAGLK